jgi:hypothetical protein
MNCLVYGLLNDIWRKVQCLGQAVKERIRSLEISCQDLLQATDTFGQVLIAATRCDLATAQAKFSTTLLDESRKG